MANILTDYFAEQLIINGQAVVVSPGLAGILSAAKVDLITDDFIPTSQTLYADIHVPTYAGYAAKNATFSLPGRRREGGIATNSALLRFFEASTITAVQITGVVVTDGGGTPLALWFDIFPSPVNLSDAFSEVLCSVQFALGGPDWGSTLLGS